jgi:cytochrome c oxidase assembly protein subunit 15
MSLAAAPASTPGPRRAGGWSRFQRAALIAFLCVEVLLFVGAVVRASGSGLGCPDWPFCYGCLVPPTRAEDIDFNKLDLERFRKKAEQAGRDPSEITVESLRAEFDPVATWVEYINRLTSLPVGLSVLWLVWCGAAEGRRGRPALLAGSMGALFLVGLNAWLGAKVVLSGLKPGIITLHMALAVLLLCVLVWLAWRGADRPWRVRWRARPDGRLILLGWALFALVVAEGVLGSQVRELTDELAHSHAGEPRIAWTAELEGSGVYLVHRSFSWLLVALALWFWWRGRVLLRTFGWLEIGVVGLVGSQMVLGIVLAHVGVLPVAQVLHVGLSSLLVSGLWLWLLGAMESRKTPVAAPAGAG